MTNAGAFKVTKIQGTTVSATAPTLSGQVLRYNTTGTQYLPGFIQMSDLRSITGGSSGLTTSCGIDKTMSWDSVSDSITCVAIGNLNASAITAGQLPVARGGTGVDATSITQNFVFAAPAGSAGAPTFRALAASDLPASASYWQSATGGINYAGGNVGIGTTSPGSLLSLSAATPELSITGSSSNYHNGAVVFTATQGSAARGLGNYMYDTGGQVEWYMGRPYGTGIIGGSDNFIIGRKASLAAHDASTNAPANALMTVTSSGNVGIGTTAPTVSLDVSSRTDAIRVPNGTSAQQPGQASMPAAANGMLRYNSTSNVLEGYVNGAWTNLATVGGNQSFSGNVSVGGTLTSTGAATFNGGATVAGGALAMSNQNITGVGANLTGQGALTLAAGGTNQAVTLKSSGTGAANIGTGSGTGLSVLDAGATTANYVTVKGAAAGSSPVIGTAGSDTDIDLIFTPKGTGRTIFSSGNVGIGVSSPSYRLDLSDSTSSGLRSVSTNGTTTTTLIHNATSLNFTRTATNAATLVKFTTADTLATRAALQVQSNGGSTEVLWAGANGSVGIGTASPNLSSYTGTTTTILSSAVSGGNLELASSATDASGTYVGALNFNATANTSAADSRIAFIRGITAGATANHRGGELSFVTKPNNGTLTEAMRISSGGNVGIGTTTPAHRLSNQSANIVDQSAAGEAGLNTFSWSHPEDGNWGYAAAIQNAGTTAGNHGLLVKVANGTSSERVLTATSNGVDRFVVRADGNVGIGTTNPTATLHAVNATGLGITMESSGIEANLNLVSTSTGGRYWRLVSGGSGGGLAGGRFGVWDNNAGIARLAIDSSGNVGIGTTNPTGNLHISGGPNTSTLLISPTTMGMGDTATIRFADPDNGTGPMDIKYTDNGSPSLNFIGGNVGVGTTSPSERLHVVGNLRVQGSTDCTLGNGAGGTNCSSDIRLKDNVTEIEDSLNKVLSLRGVEFNWNEKSQSPGRHDIGVIAQDVEKAFPTAVMEDAHTGYKKVDYAVLVAPVIQALKELNQRIQDLFSASQGHSDDIALLRAENSRLKADSERLKASDEAKGREIASVKAEAAATKAQSEIDKKELKQENAAKAKELEELKARMDRLERMLKAK